MKSRNAVFIDETGFVLDSGGYGPAAFCGAGALDRAKTRVRFGQRNVGVPRRPGGPPHL